MKNSEHKPFWISFWMLAILLVLIVVGSIIRGTFQDISGSSFNLNTQFIKASWFSGAFVVIFALMTRIGGVAPSKNYSNGWVWLLIVTILSAFIFPLMMQAVYF